MNDPESQQPHSVTTFGIAPDEQDTYDLKDREEKEKLTAAEVRAHWDTRAQRLDVQSVMSARHSVEENRQATIELQKEIFDFLEGLVEGKKVFELGVGIGRMTAELAKRAATVVGTDLSPVMLERARQNLKDFPNVELLFGKITDLDLPSKSFDLLFESIVLLHILNPEELKVTIARMQDLADTIFIVEHTYEGPNFPISKYSILRTPEEYERLFAPYELVKHRTHSCAGDKFTLMLFKKDTA